MSLILLPTHNFAFPHVDVDCDGELRRSRWRVYSRMMFDQLVSLNIVDCSCISLPMDGRMNTRLHLRSANGLNKEEESILGIIWTD